MEEYLELPSIITLEDCGGDAQRFLEETYRIFEQDFLKHRPQVLGKQLGLKSMPLYEGRSCSYYHFTHEGNVEIERTPDLRRMERISWFMFLIKNIHHPYLKVWRVKRDKWERILILHVAERYLVILEDRISFMLPWTAFYIRDNARIKRYIEEFNAYKKAEAAQGH